MKIFITGGSGFVGRSLSAFLLDRGHCVIAVGYRLRTIGDLTPSDHFEYLRADTTQKGPWQKELNEADAVINLAGLTIFKRWSRRYKQRIYDSRIRTTRHIVEALEPDRQRVLCSASAIGYYGNRDDDILTETEPPGNDFLATVSRDWESEALAAKEKSCRVVTARFGIVLGKSGGALSKMIPAFKAYAGGPIGSGKQWFSWIHMEDLTAALLFTMENRKLAGPVNFCAPNPVRNRDLATSLGRCLNRPAVVPAPTFMIRALLGEMGSTLLASQRVIPEKLTESGFTFRYPDIDKAIDEIVYH